MSTDSGLMARRNVPHATPRHDSGRSASRHSLARPEPGAQEVTDDPVLVVHHDLDLAGQEVDSLRRYGYEVTECAGPTRNVCPVLAGHACDLAERADVLVYDVWASGDADGSKQLIDNIRDVHPDTPVVLTSPGFTLSWEEEMGPHAVTTLTGQPTGERLHSAIQEALATGERSAV